MVERPAGGPVESESLSRTRRLCADLVDRTGIDGVGVAVFATESTRDLVFASDEVAEELDELQFTVGEGPCLEAFRSHAPQLHDDVSGRETLDRFPVFSALAATAGAGSVYAYPLMIGEVPFGVLELYGHACGALAAREDVTCRIFAQSIAHVVLAELDSGVGPFQPVGARVFTRGNVHVAAGIVAVRLNVSVDEALVRLRGWAFAEQRRITAIAREIVNGERIDLAEM
ncbi:GAF and ANTAR domain-containing protein [Rhodococcus qingshengii]|uniref:GAF and ANTAR domain-containing protein n=1 Tax=Rhodococcus qingshengii TaxID=334542 RepID=UPI001BE63ACF|nr:GAF and ANTAR domain-containing protein [Rhodococcus qingshengii]MBT2274414.1 GAF and ANTAR domain-containing protein [Rhodococcus qingshengii]